MSKGRAGSVSGKNEEDDIKNIFSALSAAMVLCGALAKANVGKNSHASSDSGSSGHLSMEMLKQAAGLQLTHVLYKGGGPAITDTIGGQVPLVFVNQDNALPHVMAGKLRALAVTSLARNPVYPDAPSITDPRFFCGVVVRAIGSGGNAARRDQAAQRGVDQSAGDGRNSRTFAVARVRAGGNCLAEFFAFIRDAITKWGRAAKASGATLD